MSFNYKGAETRSYDLFVRDIWSIIVEHVTDPKLAHHWNWEPVRLSRWDEKEKVWKRFIDEPNTADGLWNMLVSVLGLLIHIMSSDVD